jgi:hypothetical protein
MVAVCMRRAAQTRQGAAMLHRHDHSNGARRMLLLDLPLNRSRINDHSDASSFAERIPHLFLTRTMSVFLKISCNAILQSTAFGWHHISRAWDCLLYQPV